MVPLMLAGMAMSQAKGGGEGGEGAPGGMPAGLPPMNGGSATAGDSSNESGDWSGSQINMGGGSKELTKVIFFVTASVLTFGLFGVIAWALTRKK